jgi:hypothetical protein
MNLDDSLRTQLASTFLPLNKVAAVHAFPPPRTLTNTLEKLMPQGKAGQTNISLESACYFATAAVDIWLRGVHSFLVSASLTDASPLWSSVAGYYSSHYAVRGLAHLLGYFQLFRKKKIIELKLDKGKYVCSYRSKGSGGGEHQVYWKLVKQSAVFGGDGLFTENNPDLDCSDAKHRNYANYSDHLAGYPQFHTSDEKLLKDRIEYISKIVFDAPPIPRTSEFPDLAAVQVIAYHRVVRFRNVLDEVLGGKNRFWQLHRNPSFAMSYMDFQLAEGTGLAQPSKE